MSKITSKLQVTLPKAIADQFSIRPGDEIQWETAAGVIRVIPPRASHGVADVKERLDLFDQATERIRKRKSDLQKAPDRGWKRADLYER